LEWGIYQLLGVGLILAGNAVVLTKKWKLPTGKNLSGESVSK